jgi:signal transduction histidine kinase
MTLLVRLATLLAFVLPLAAAQPVTPAQLGAVHAAALDSSGLVWFGGPAGLFRWDGAHLLQQDGWEGWEGGAVAALGVDGRGRLWAHADSGLFVLEEQFRRLDIQSPVIQGRGRRLDFSGDATWLASDRGLLRVDGRGAERELLTGIAVTALAPLGDGGLLAGSAGRGLFAFDREGNPRLGEVGSLDLDEIADLEGDGSGGIWLLGRAGREAWSLWRLRTGEAPTPGLRLNAVLDGDAPRWLQRHGAGLLIRTATAWQQLEEDGRLRALSLPPPGPGAPGLCRWLPGLCLDPPGRFHLETPAAGMLVRREAEVALAWQGSGLPTLQPVQVAAAEDGRSWVLLEDERGQRRLLEQDAAGVRERRPDPLLAGAGELQTICALPGGRGLLAGWSDRVLRLEPGGDRLLSDRFGAHWLEAFGGELVLLGGAGGLALLEGDTLRELRIREPVHRAVPDGFRGLLAACDGYLLRLDALNQIDTVAYPEAFAAEAGDGPAGRRVRQLLTGEAGRFWLLADEGAYYRAGDQAGWTRPLEGRLPAAAEAPGGLLSMALDGAGRVWISTRAGTGWLEPDRLPPVVVLLQDPRRLDFSDPALVLQTASADPFAAGRPPRLRWRLGEGPWSSWMAPGPLPLAGLLPVGFHGVERLQLQAMDGWGNLSRRPLTLTLAIAPGSARLPFVQRLALLLSLVGVSVLVTSWRPGGLGLGLSLAAGLAAGAWVRLNSEEPLLWWALPIIVFLTSRLVSQQLRERAQADSGPGLLDLVDRFREFGHSGSATRNIDRLLRTSRNLYLDGRPDAEVLERYRSARGVFLELTRPSLEELLKAFRRLDPVENPVTPSELELFADLVREVGRRLDEAGDPPGLAALEELAFQLDRLEKTLGELEHRVDLQVSSAPLKVLDRVLDSRGAELAGVELALSCEREVRQVLARLPVDKLQFILDNLVDNALHWMRGQPRQRLEIEVAERPSLLQIRVRDSGPGVPAADRERIFEPGFSGRAAGSGGGGYGLHRSRELLARFGGRLELEDGPPGSGASFLLEIKKVEPERR